MPDRPPGVRAVLLQPETSGCFLWLLRCHGGSHWRHSPADGAERTCLFFQLKSFSANKQTSATARPSAAAPTWREEPAGPIHLLVELPFCIIIQTSKPIFSCTRKFVAIFCSREETKATPGERPCAKALGPAAHAFRRPGPQGSGASCPVLGGKGHESQNKHQRFSVWATMTWDPLTPSPLYGLLSGLRPVVSRPVPKTSDSQSMARDLGGSTKVLPFPTKYLFKAGLIRQYTPTH